MATGTEKTAVALPTSRLMKGSIGLVVTGGTDKPYECKSTPTKYILRKRRTFPRVLGVQLFNVAVGGAGRELRQYDSRILPVDACRR